ncbi:DUF2834 domain-containing protein [Acidaminobacter sp. JC074]|nr:DUF2834 domain-containing protein [Acidaminobacter sp. JC074]
MIPFTIFIPWLSENGLNLSLFVSEWFINRISQFFAADFIVSWLCFLVFLIVDSKKYEVKYWWLSLIGSCCIGLSFGLPFYLFLREGKTELKKVTTS